MSKHLIKSRAADRQSDLMSESKSRLDPLDTKSVIFD